MSFPKRFHKWWKKTLAATFEWLKKRWRHFLIGVWAFLHRPFRSIWIALKWIWNTIIGVIWWLIVPLWSLLRSILQWIGDRTLKQVVRFALWSVVTIAVLIGGGLLLAVQYPASQVPEFGPAVPIVYQEQGWTGGLESEDRQTYYYTPQGAGNVFKHMRYSWFVNLEQPWGKTRVAKPEHMLAYGFQVDAQASTHNPDLLPVGFTRLHDKELDEDLLDVTCAACHSGALLVRNKKDGSLTSLRIDGGQAMHAFTAINLPHFAPVMIASMASTLLNPWKWERFARNVLKDDYSDTASDVVRREFKKTFYALLKMGINENRYHLSPTQEGYSRTDALARIANQVFGDHITPKNYHVGNAPVNYPPLWDIWKFDWVQYSASVAQPMARNVGESLGVGATYDFFDLYRNPVKQENRYATTSNMIGLHEIEVALRKLRPPLWNEAILGEIDQARAVRGGIAFIRTCQGCHGPHQASARQRTLEMPGKDPQNLPHWKMKSLYVEEIGTDPHAARNFVRNTYDLTSTGLTDAELRRIAGGEWELRFERELNYDFGEAINASCKARRDETDPGDCAAWRVARAEYDSQLTAVADSVNLQETTVGVGLWYVGLLMKEYEYRKFRDADPDEWTDEKIAEYNGFDALDLPRVHMWYKARSLGGMWATAPFLHNGSVPTLYQLLSPRTERDAEFFIGRPEFDTENVGIKNNGKKTGGIWFDTSEIGNANTGHEFRDGYSQWEPGIAPQYGVIGKAYSHDERMELIEYLKVHLDDPPHSGLFGEAFAGVVAEVARTMQAPYESNQIGTDWPHGEACNLREYIGNHKNAPDLSPETTANIELIDGHLDAYFYGPGKDTCGDKTYKQKGEYTDA